MKKLIITMILQKQIEIFFPEYYIFHVESSKRNRNRTWQMSALKVDINITIS